MAVAKIGVRELAKELGVTDRELLDYASKINIRPVMAMLEPAQANLLRNRIRAAHGSATAGPALAAKAVVQPTPPAAAVIPSRMAPAGVRPAVSGKPGPAGRTAPIPVPVLPTAPPVLRRRSTGAETADLAPADQVVEQAPPEPVQPLPVVEERPSEPIEVEAVPEVVVAITVDESEPIVAASEPVAPRLPRVPDNTPRIKRIKASDLEIPPELQLRIHLPAPKPDKVAGADLNESAATQGSALHAGDSALHSPEAATANAATAEDVAASAARNANAGHDGKLADTKPAPRAAEVRYADNDPRAFAAKRKALEAAAETGPKGVRLEDIGKALDASAALPSTSRKPTLRRMAMPDALVNLPPKPAPKPVAETPAPAAPAAAGVDAFGARIGRDPATPDPAGAGRGRKLIYDRHRDSQSSAADVRGRGKKKAGKGSKALPIPVAVAQPTKAEKRHLRIEDTITVANLAHQLSVKATEVVKKLFSLGMLANVNQPLDLDTVELIANDFGFTVENVGFDLEQYLQKPDEATAALPVPRSPVVTVMGHVDHGKTSLLDAIRKTHTAQREAGGITQHIGAYVAQVRGDQFDDGKPRRVVFLDTPGHEAFSAMRARGAKATDVIVLVVAADDGVMPQTIEAISHAKAAKVPIVVAVNKIDKPGADVEKVRRELADHGVVAEEWGGDAIFVEVSAKTGQNLDKMLEMLALQADLMELTARVDVDPRGLVIESRLERGRGPVATVLVQAGTLRKGQFIVAGPHYCRVRAMLDDAGKNLEFAGPSTPVELIGFDHVTVAGDEFYVVADEKRAKAIVEHRIEKSREKELLKTAKRTFEDVFGTTGEPQQKELNVIVKADVHGSAEALKQSLAKIGHEEIKVRVLHAAVGGVTESDINLAATTKGLVIAFNVKPEAKGKRLADELGVQIRQYTVIYDAIDAVTMVLEGMLTPIIEEVVLGHAEVRQIFAVPKLGVIAGSHVTDGTILRSQRLRLLRGTEVLHDGEFASLKRFKDDAREVTQGYDCGIGVTGFTKFQVGDVVQCYELKKIPRKLKPEPASGRSASAA